MLAVFAGAFRRWHGAEHLVEAMRQLRDARRQDDLSAVLIGDGPELPRVRAAAEGLPNVSFTGAVAARRACRRAWPRRTSASRRSRRTRTRPLALGFYWSPLKIFEYMASGLPVVAPALPRIAALAAHGRGGAALRAGGSARPRRCARARCAIPRCARGSAPRRASARVRDYSWDAHCGALEAALIGASAMTTRSRSTLHEARRVNVLIVTDAFPPVCGGSGWSTYELARGLRRAATRVLVVQPRPGTAETRARDGVRRLPRARIRHGGARRCRTSATTSRTSGSTRGSPPSSTPLIAREQIDIVHAQHVMTSLPAIDAAHRRRRAGRSARCATTGRSATGRT